MNEHFIFIMDLIGAVAFAFSGATLAIRKSMDIFGVNILAVTTACGGGVLRDIVLGEFPPVMFRNPVYALTAIVTANMIFLLLYIQKKRRPFRNSAVYEKLLFWCDTLGLAAFTVEGTVAGIHAMEAPGLLLMCFVGVITGVGGGVLRDMMAGELPSIFVKKIYAVASLAGALTAALLYRYIGEARAMTAGFLLVIVIRCLAAHFKWNLPRI